MKKVFNILHMYAYLKIMGPCFEASHHQHIHISMLLPTAALFTELLAWTTCHQVTAKINITQHIGTQIYSSLQ